MKRLSKRARPFTDRKKKPIENTRIDFLQDTLDKAKETSLLVVITPAIKSSSVPHVALLKIVIEFRLKY